MLITCFCFTCFFAIGQKKLKTELDNFGDSMKAQTAELFNPNNPDHYRLKTNPINFIFIPYCNFKWNQILNFKKFFNLIYAPKKDSNGVEYQMNLLHDSLVIIPSSLPNERLLNTSIYTSIYTSIGDDDYIYSDRYFQMYRYAVKISKYAFVLRLDGGFSPYKSEVFCYILGNKLKVLAFNGLDKSRNVILTKYETIQDFIIEKFGGLEMYYEAEKSLYN